MDFTVTYACGHTEERRLVGSDTRDPGLVMERIADRQAEAAERPCPVCERAGPPPTPLDEARRHAFDAAEAALQRGGGPWGAYLQQVEDALVADDREALLGWAETFKDNREHGAAYALRRVLDLQGRL